MKYLTPNSEKGVSTYFSKFQDMVMQLMKTVRNASITLGWAIVIAALVLQAFYSGHSYSLEYLNTYGPALTLFDMILLFALSILPGFISFDLDLLVKMFFWALGLSVALIYLCITLPSYLGIITIPVLQEFLSEGAIAFIFRSMVPSSVICLMGALLGGFLGERLLHPTTAS